jgi:hypothetical protein
VREAPDGSLLEVDYGRRHLRFGWWSLFAFTALGLGLEVLHGLKVDVYLNVASETRRFMWTLAHAHGTLLAIVHVVYGLAVRLALAPSRHQRLVSASLTAASFLLPGGFFLGGIAFYSGDPGLGGVLIPIGATLLLVAILLLARGSSAIVRAQLRSSHSDREEHAGRTEERRGATRRR